MKLIIKESSQCPSNSIYVDSYKNDPSLVYFAIDNNGESAKLGKLLVDEFGSISKSLMIGRFEYSLDNPQQLKNYTGTGKYPIRDHLYPYKTDQAIYFFATLDTLDVINEYLKKEQPDLTMEDHRYDFWAKQLVAQVQGLTLEIGTSQFAFDTLSLPIEIDDRLLNGCINTLEKLNNPIADLTCGLLLEGWIETTSDILENCNAYDEHREKRYHDAISFYSKAANDATVKPMVDFVLRNMKAQYPIHSVQNRLALYDLAHEDNFNCELNLVTKNQLGVRAPLLSSFGVFNSSPDSKSTEVSISTHFSLS